MTNNNLSAEKSYMSSTTYNSLTSLKSEENARKKDSIPFRIQFVQELLKNKSLRSLIDFAQTDTEYFKHGTVMEESVCDNDSGDTRVTLHKNVENFYKIISNIGGRLLYVKSGTTGHTFKGVIECDKDTKYEYALKVVAYPKKEKYGDIYDCERPENAEIMMLRLLSYFIVNKQTPHIILPIATFNTHISAFLTLLDDEVVDEKDKKYVEFLERYSNGQLHDEVSILLSEWANRGDLLDYIRSKYRNFQLIHWKVFFFQLISCLAVIQSKFPDFRHNDLKANNVLLHKISKDKQRFTYIVLREKYIVPNIGYSIKLWDFDFACIPGLVNNIKVKQDWTRDINVTPVKHQYYDIHYFFNTLAFAGFFPSLMTSSNISIEVKNFIKRVIPPKYRSKYCLHQDDLKKKYKDDLNKKFIKDNKIIDELYDVDNLNNKIDNLDNNLQCRILEYCKNKLEKKENMKLNSHDIEKIKEDLKNRYHHDKKKLDKETIECGECHKYVHSKGRLKVSDEYTTPEIGRAHV